MRLATTIDSTTLPSDQAKALQGLVEAAHFFDLPAQIPAPAKAASALPADQFHYRVTIESEGKRHTVEAGEAAGSPALQALLQELMIRARSARGA